MEQTSAAMSVPAQENIDVTRLSRTQPSLRLAFALLIAFALLHAGHAAAQVTATIHGYVQNAAGQPITKGEVKLTTDKTLQPQDRKYPFSFPIDGTGNYKGAGIVPGDYIIIVEIDGKSIDFQNVVLKAGDDVKVDFDMTRAEFLKNLTPEELKQLEEVKKHNAGAVAENAKIANLNATLVQARADEKNGKPDDAVAALQPLTVQRPDESVLWSALGEAQLASAEAAEKAARAAKTNPSAQEIQDKYMASAASYQKAIDTNATSKKPSPENVSGAYLNMGKDFAKTGKLDRASAAYENAVKALPSSAASAYYNEAATFYNAQQPDQAAAAADKAIAADPKRPILYYIKAQSLVGKATLDPKTQKFILPPGCVEAYQEYLELEPNGEHAAEVKEILTGLGQPVVNSFKAGRKK